jgi:hypothetical protein
VDVKNSLIGLALVSSLTIAGAANANFVMTIDDLGVGGVEQTLFDGDNDGVITFAGAVGAFSVNVTTGVSKPAINGPQLLDLNSIDVSGGAGTLRISLTDTDYTGSPPSFDALFGGTAAIGGSIDFSFYYDDANTEFGIPNQITSSTGNTNAFSGAGSSAASVTAPYSLTIIATVDHTGSGVSSFDAEIRTVVPVPAAVWLFGSGLAGLAGISRRLKKA